MRGAKRELSSVVDYPEALAEPRGHMGEGDLRIRAFLQREREAFEAGTAPDPLFMAFAAYHRRFGSLDIPLMVAGSGRRAEEVAMLLMNAALRRGTRTSYPEFCRAMRQAAMSPSTGPDQHGRKHRSCYARD
jgi:hypothetical protein